MIGCQWLWFSTVCPVLLVLSARPPACPVVALLVHLSKYVPQARGMLNLCTLWRLNESLL
jgi:hypothetical protein